ncbi:Uu.00g129240.m01.CDS01 [Anthostomella pinea]|uniref:Uu.00g129240.m01.CDS01 n=1 Tax=Anthostomella pinea TaxID=933095 RepID=A0AAI8VJE7_9PEZI|nr:Uu.00g129240.m01.CDS01 [Anthostomella pinea]
MSSSSSSSSPPPLVGLGDWVLSNENKKGFHDLHLPRYLCFAKETPVSPVRKDRMVTGSCIVHVNGRLYLITAAAKPAEKTAATDPKKEFEVPTQIYLGTVAHYKDGYAIVDIGDSFYPNSAILEAARGGATATTIAWEWLDRAAALNYLGLKHEPLVTLDLTVGQLTLRGVEPFPLRLNALSDRDALPGHDLLGTLIEHESDAVGIVRTTRTA